MDHVNSFITFGFGLTMGKIFKKEGEFVVISVDNEHVYPFGDRSMHIVAKYLFKLFNTNPGEIDYKINYNKKISTNRKKRVHHLVNQDILTEKFILSSLTYL